MNNIKNKNFSFIFSIIIVFLAVITAVVFYSNPKNESLDDFASCLTSSGFVMYGSETCSWCQKEESNFKDSWRLISYVDCRNETPKCLEKGIQATPTWILSSGEMIVGYQGLEKLSQISGCKLSK